jgi:aerobic carbon-monoxide dehydrogenase medium subunit
VVAPPFEYVSVAAYDEAVEALATYGEDAKILAGGQSLVPMMNLRIVRPSALVDVNRVPTDRPILEGSFLRLGAVTRHRTLLDDTLVRRHCPLLAEAVRNVGNVRVRTRGTIGGSLAHADPTAEIGACALVLDAELTALSRRGSRTIPVRELFVTYLTTCLEPDEVVTEVRVPVIRQGEGWGFREMVRRSSDLAIVAVAARLELDETKVVRSADLSVAGVADRVVLAAPALLGPLVGSRGGETTITEVAAALAESVEPDSDVHASAQYRRRLVEVLTRRALGDALSRATSNDEAG